MAVGMATANLVLYIGLGWYTSLMAKRASGKSIRMLWQLPSLPIAAVVVGGVHLVVTQVVQQGWLPERHLDALLGPWQMVQSLVSAGIGFVLILRIRQVAHRFAAVESVAGQIVDRLEAVSIRDLSLTQREREVLRVIGASRRIDDRTLAEQLGVSPDTAHTHVTNLLRKAKLKDRRDLAILSFLLRDAETGRDN